MLKKIKIDNTFDIVGRDVETGNKTLRLILVMMKIETETSDDLGESVLQKTTAWLANRRYEQSFPNRLQPFPTFSFDLTWKKCRDSCTVFVVEVVGENRWKFWFCSPCHKLDLWDIPSRVGSFHQSKLLEDLFDVYTHTCAWEIDNVGVVRTAQKHCESARTHLLSIFPHLYLLQFERGQYSVNYVKLFQPFEPQ